MDKTERINRIVDAVGTRLTSEIESLLATEFTVEPAGNQLVSKEDAFADLKGKQISAQIGIEGDVTGTGCLLIGIKDGIRLGGTLIMLPVAELDEVIGREEYSEEIEDSYGEIANIIAGAFTADFEEMYPKSCRFIRKEQEIIVPKDIDVTSSHPVEDQLYYRVTLKMALDGRAMGNLVLLMPASSFGLEAGDSEESDAVKIESEPAETNSGGEQADTPASVPSKKSNISFSKRKQRIDLLLDECRGRLESELSALMGLEITVRDLENRVMSKENFFSETVLAKQVLADMVVEGDFNDTSYLSINIKDAIFLGGSLIMLPPSELETVVSEGDFGEDAKDAYGEIANIISGIYTAVFEENYIDKLRFIRKDLHEVSPGKVDYSSDQPIPDKNYYASSMSLSVDKKALGQMHMLIPVEVLQLQEDAPTKKPDDATNHAEASAAVQAAEQPQHSQDDNTEPVQKVADKDPHAAGIDTKKQKKYVDRLLASCHERMAEEIEALIGIEVKLEDLDNAVVTKGDFFEDKVFNEQVIAKLDVVGEIEGKSYISVDTTDAIRIGGVLIMLPESELDNAVSEKNFTDDIKDAYGEIANIISGVCTGVFEEEFTKKIRFVKTGLSQVSPVRVDIESDEPMPDQHYYLSRTDIRLVDKTLGKINVLIPLDILSLNGLIGAESDSVEQQADEQLSRVLEPTSDFIPNAAAAAEDYKNVGTFDILLVGDDVQEADKINRVLREVGYGAKSITTKENVQNFISGHLKAVYLVMSEVNEQAFGLAIQVSSANGLPVIAAAPGWTRSKVIKAVKYGVQDILLTPASDDDIKENIANNLLQRAA